MYLVKIRHESYFNFCFTKIVDEIEVVMKPIHYLDIQRFSDPNQHSEITNIHQETHFHTNQIIFRNITPASPQTPKDNNPPASA